MEQFITQLGHEGCITVVVLSLVALVIIVITLSVLAAGLYESRRGDLRTLSVLAASALGYAERMQRAEYRQAVYLALIEKGVSGEEALQAVNQFYYD